MHTPAAGEGWGLLRYDQRKNSSELRPKSTGLRLQKLSYVACYGMQALSVLLYAVILCIRQCQANSGLCRYELLKC